MKRKSGKERIALRSVERHGDRVYIGDFTGSVCDSPSHLFSVAWGMFSNHASREEKHFALLQGSNVVTQGSVSRPILDGRCSDRGYFALQVQGDTGKATVLLFGPNGEQYHSWQFEELQDFYDISEDGNFLFRMTENTIHYTDVLTKKDLFSFPFYDRFSSIGARLDADGQTVFMRDAYDMGWYRFSTTGTFLDEARWLNDYIKTCNGVCLYVLIRERQERQGICSAEDVEYYAFWIEEALRRGIEDSFCLKVADVYSYLATLYRLAGKTDAAEMADWKAEQSLDGFRLVGRAVSQVSEIGDPPNEQVAHRLIADLDRAAQTPKLHQYPNYKGKLYRTKGEILERIGEKEGAITAYRMALEANPKAGCIKRLEKLMQMPWKKPSPRTVESRIDFARGTMFHFRCPICGSTPGEKPLTKYIAGWKRSEPERLQRLLSHLLSATWEIFGGKSRVRSKKFQAQADQLIQNLLGNDKENAFAPSPFLLSIDDKMMTMQTRCPVCDQDPGKRAKDKYFTVWPEACGVQICNLYYEVGLILHGVMLAKPAWMSDVMRNRYDMIKSQVFRTGESIGLPSCPQCGRFANGIAYKGGDKDTGMCRWCRDVSGHNRYTHEMCYTVEQFAAKFGKDYRPS